MVKSKFLWKITMFVCRHKWKHKFKGICMYLHDKPLRVITTNVQTRSKLCHPNRIYNSTLTGIVNEFAEFSYFRKSNDALTGFCLKMLARAYQIIGSNPFDDNFLSFSSINSFELSGNTQSWQWLQLLMRINQKQFPMESILMQIYICHGVLNWNSDDWK